MPEHQIAALIATGTGLILIVVGIGLLIQWIISIVDVLKSDYEGNGTKVTWMVLLLLLPPIGTILYQIIGTKQKAGYKQVVNDRKPLRPNNGEEPKPF